MWQNLGVFSLVLGALAYAGWYYLPATLRQRLGRLTPRLARAPSCGSCSDCSGCAPKSAADESRFKSIQFVERR